MQLSPETSHILAVVADAYTPVLLVLALFYVAQSWFRGNKWHLVQLAYAVIVVYGLMFIDKYFQLWARLGLDYSTHSAAAFVLIAVIGINRRPSFTVPFVVSFFLYGCLMNLLNYHSWADILSTIIMVSVILFPVFRWLKSLHKAPQN